MAGWDRYGESQKYTEVADTNKNPKHVGESLRQLALEDRLELRRQQRELQKKRKLVSSKTQVELLPEEDEAKFNKPSQVLLDEVDAPAVRPSKVIRPNIRPKSIDNGVVILGDETVECRKNDVSVAVIVLAEDEAVDTAPPTCASSAVCADVPAVAPHKAAAIDVDVEADPVVSEGAKRRALRKARAAHSLHVCVLD